MALNTKRRKLLDDPKSNDPIIFQSPGLQPDTRLTVFGTEFHVHSIILRLHSSYFRKFLDSPDKAPVPATARCRYDYISTVDDDGEWGLEVATQIFKEDKELQLVVIKAHSGVKGRILEASLQISRALIEDRVLDKIVRNVGNEIDIQSQPQTMLTAEYFRNLLLRLQQAEDYEYSPLMEAVTGVLESNLVLDRGYYVAGTECDGSGDKCGYLCATIEDSDLPWDADEVDW